MKQYVHTNTRGVTYYLRSREVTLRGGKSQKIYYFTKNPDIDTSIETDKPSSLPEDKIILENPRNGFLSIVRKESRLAKPSRKA